MVEFRTDAEVINAYKNLYQIVALGNAFVSKGYVHQNRFRKFFTSGIYATYYFFFKEKRLDQNDYFSANPDLDMARQIWNLLDSPYIKKMYCRILPNIKINKKIYIPHSDTTITLDNINNLPIFQSGSTDERGRTKILE